MGTMFANARAARRASAAWGPPGEHRGRGGKRVTQRRPEMVQMNPTDAYRFPNCLVKHHLQCAWWQPGWGSTVVTMDQNCSGSGTSDSGCAGSHQGRAAHRSAAAGPGGWHASAAATRIASLGRQGRAEAEAGSAPLSGSGTGWVARQRRRNTHRLAREAGRHAAQGRRGRPARTPYY